MIIPPHEALASYHSLGRRSTFGGGTGPAHDAWIGLGSNLGEPAVSIRRALRWMSSMPSVDLIVCSSLYRTDPVGPPQPRYVNAVAVVRTTLAPLRLLGALQTLERAAGRRAGPRWGPRPLDLDLLLFGELCLDLPELTLPHPRAAERRFVLEPICEIAPELVHPTLQLRFDDLLRQLLGRSRGVRL